MTLKDKKALIIALTWLDSALLTFLIYKDVMSVLLCHTTWTVLLSVLYFCKPFMRWFCKKGDTEK